MKPYASGNISESIKQEWMAKEEGSYSDSKKSQSHVYAILARSPKGKWVADTKEEAETLANSAEYQTHWDGDDPEERRLISSCKRIYNKLQSL